MTLKQSLVIIAGVILVLVLYFLRNTPEQKTAFDALMEEGKEALSAEQLEQIELLEDKVAKGDDLESYSKLKDAWGKAGNEGIAAFYAYQAANAKNTATAWEDAGDKLTLAYTKARNREMDPSLVFFFVSMAVKSYERAVELAPENPDLKTDLALTYAEGEGAIMKGVQMLRKAVEQEPNNIRANMALGRFSMISGQYDKAMERYAIVLKNEPENVEALVMMSSSLQAVGNNAEAVNYLERAAVATKDESLKKEIINKIEELKS